MRKEEFIKGLKFLGLAYNKEFDEQQAMVWYDFFKETDYEDFRNAVKRIIPIKQFMPSIAELKEECEKVRNTKAFGILEVMKQDGYFKKGKFGELDEVQQFRNYEKANMWLRTEKMPAWFKEDMKKYEEQLNQKQISSNQKKLEVAYE